jgi:hypothetical protein
VVRRSLIPALVILLLLVGASSAQAAAYEIGPHPPTAVTDEQVTFQAERTNPGQGMNTLRWDFGDGSSVTTTEMTVSHAYTAAGPYVVTLSVVDSDGTPPDLQDATTITVTQRPNAAPSASFTFTPNSPVAGEPVSFEGGTDPDGDPVTREWNFGDGTTTDPGPAPSHTYANAGAYTVTLTVSDGHGASDTSSQTVTVAERPAGSPPPGDGGTQTFNQLGGSGSPTSPLVPTPNAPAPAIMRPFPVVRIAGVVLPRGARVRILSVRGPRGMQVRVRCRGRGCPVRSMGLTSANRLARLHRFERRLAAGTTLELFVRKPGKIGKYTRFLIRAGAPPKRVDLCLFPNRRSPGRCP